MLGDKLPGVSTHIILIKLRILFMICVAARQYDGLSTLGGRGQEIQQPSVYFNE